MVTHNCIHIHTHVHTHRHTYTLACVGMEPGSRPSAPCPHLHSQQMPLLGPLSPGVPSMVGGWIPLSIPPILSSCDFSLSPCPESKAVAGRQRAEPLCRHTLVPRLLTRRRAGPVPWGLTSGLSRECESSLSRDRWCV